MGNNTDSVFEGMTDSQRALADRLVKEDNPEAILAPYPEAFAGILHRCGTLPSVALYDADRCMELIIEEGSADLTNANDVLSYCLIESIQTQGMHSEAIMYFAANDAAIYEDAEEIPEFEEALLGVVEQSDTTGLTAGYDKQKCISIVMERDNIGLVEAEKILANIDTPTNGKNSPTFIEIVQGYDYATFSDLEDVDDLVETAVYDSVRGRVIGGCKDGSVLLWDADTGVTSQMLEGHSEIVQKVAICPNGTRIASASNDKTVRIWDIETGQQIYSLVGHTGFVCGVAFSPDGRSLASGSNDGTLRIWDMEHGREINTISDGLDRVACVAFNPNNNQIVCGCVRTESEERPESHSVMLWNLEKEHEPVILDGHNSYVECVAFSPDGSRIVSGSDDGTAIVWDTALGQCMFALKGHTDWVRSAVFSPDGNRIATGSFSGTIKLWDANTGVLQQTLKKPQRMGAIAFSPNGMQIVRANYNKKINIWNVS